MYAALLADATKPTTRRGRISDIRDLARSMNFTEPAAAVVALLGDGSGQCNAWVTRYKAEMLQRRQAPATINRKLSTLGRLVKLARRMGVIDWLIEVESVKGQSYRDTRGPGRSGWLRMEAAARKVSARTDQGRRDYAILRLLYDLGLRRAEVVELDVSHWDPETARLSIMGKGRGDRELLDVVGAPTCAALEAWLEVRGREPGPLFIRCDHAADEVARLSGNAIYELVKSIGRAAGIKGKLPTPHGIRHQSITHFAELSAGDVFATQAHARHRSATTTQVYIDNLEDKASKVRKILAEE